MKLITSYLESDLRTLVEEVALSPESGDGKKVKRTYLEGIFLQSNTRNRNNRIYPKDVLEFAVNKYVKEQVSTGRAVGELNHPEGPGINLDKVSHRIVSMKWDGANVIGKAMILPTPMGKIVEGLLEGGVKLGVSSRGVGSVLEKKSHSVVKNDFLLNAVDVVQDPSAPDAFVNGIMEGVDFFFKNGKLIAEAADKKRAEIRKLSKSQIVEKQAKLFEAFLKEISV